MALTPKNDGSGTASAAFQTSDLALGNHTIVAIYSGDDNFSSSESTDPNGSSASVSVVGQTLSINIGLVTSQAPGTTCYYEGDLATLPVNISNLYGAAFTVTVDWGDGNPAEKFGFAGGEDSASVTLTHLYNAGNGTRTISAEVTPTDPSDTRQASATTPVTVYDPGPLISTAGTPDSNADGGYSFVATAFEPWDANAVLTYQWTTPDLSSTQTSVAFTAQELTDAISGGGTLTVTDGAGVSTTVPACDWGASLPAPIMPTVSISESDPNQTVLEGGKANFDIHVNWPQEDQVPKITVYYETVDGTGTAPTDYASSDGVVPVSIPYGQSDATIQVATTPGVDDGTDASFSVQLVNFGAMCWPEVAGGGGGGGGSSATATIVHPDVTIRLPGEASGAVTVPCDGARVEVDLGATVGQAFAGSEQVVLPNVPGLLFWDSQGASTPLAPDGNGNVVDDAMPSSGQYSRTLWVSIDPSLLSGDGGVSPSDQAASQYTLVAEAVLAGAPTVTSAPLAANVAAGTWIADTSAQNPTTGLYTGHATSVGSGATLTELVYDITGNTGDLPQLLAANTNVAYNPSTMAVAPGTVIDISPLLNVLETRLRNERCRSRERANQEREV